MHVPKLYHCEELLAVVPQDGSCLCAKLCSLIPRPFLLPVVDCLGEGLGDLVTCDDVRQTESRHTGGWCLTVCDCPPCKRSDIHRLVGQYTSGRISILQAINTGSGNGLGTRLHSVG